MTQPGTRFTRFGEGRFSHAWEGAYTSRLSGIVACEDSLSDDKRGWGERPVRCRRRCEMRLRALKTMRVCVSLSCAAIAFASLDAKMGAAAGRTRLDVRSREVLSAMSQFRPLYRDIEAKYVKTLTYEAANPAADPAQAISRRVTAVHAVWQDDKYRLEVRDELSMANGSTKTFRSIFAFDGSVTRANDKFEFANVSDQRLPVYPWQPPQLLGAPDFGEFTLEDVLTMRPTVPPMPFLEGVASTDTTYVAATDIDGLSCDTLRSVLYTSEGRATAEYELDVAPERNYLIARCRRFTTDQPRRLLSVHSVSHWNEASPGVWLPTVVNGEYFAASAAGPTRFATDIVEVTSINTRPTHGGEFFSSVPMPPGRSVYHLKGGAVASVVTHPPTEREDAWPREWSWWLVGNGVLLLVVLAVLVARRRYLKIRDSARR